MTTHDLMTWWLGLAMTTDIMKTVASIQCVIVETSCIWRCTVMMKYFKLLTVALPLF